MRRSTQVEVEEVQVAEVGIVVAVVADGIAVGNQ